jgi:hypothetical protein
MAIVIMFVLFLALLLCEEDIGLAIIFLLCFLPPLLLVWWS